MSERDQLLLAAADALRATHRPSPEVEARVLKALESRLVVPPGGSSESGGPQAPQDPGGVGLPTVGSSTAAPVTLFWTAKVVGATLGIAAGGLIALRLGVQLIHAIDGSREAPVDPPHEEHFVDDRVPEHPAEDSSDPEAIEPAASTESAQRQMPTTKAGAESPAAAPQATSPSEHRADDLETELQLLTAAKRAMDASQALDILNRHAREFPAGELELERRALMAVSLCRLGRHSDAREQTRRIAEAQPGSPLLELIRRQCPRPAAQVPSKERGVHKTGPTQP